MKYANTILETIGNTPLVKLQKVSRDIRASLFVKIEYVNPGGSVKDRIGIAMIEDAEKKGLLNKGDTIIEPTSGNTGVGLAMAASVKGYKVIFIMPDKMSQEKEMVLRAFGAEVVRTPTDVSSDDPRNYRNVARTLKNKTPNSFLPNQYDNAANSLTHYSYTGPEIWNDTNGNITHLVVGIGTGGTITGIAKYLKEMNPRIKVIGVDAVGSLYYHSFMKQQKQIKSYKIEGIGGSTIPSILNWSFIDMIEIVNDKQAFTTARKLVREEGIFTGGSGGAAVFASLRIAKHLSKDNIVVTVLPDSGKNYLSKIYNDSWMKENNFL